MTLNVNPYADDNPFAEMAALVPEASAGQAANLAPAPRAAVPEADYYAAQLSLARAMFAEYEQAIKGMVNEAKTIKVENAEDERAALDLGLPLDRLYKKIEEARVSFVDPPNKYVKGVNSLAKLYQSLIDEGRKAVKARLGGYTRKKEIEAQRKALEERKAREEAHKAAAAEASALKAEAEKAGLKAPDIDLPPVEAAPAVIEKTVRSSEGSATTVKTWKFEVIDPQMVPREYLTVDEKKIRAAVKDGIRSIPGVNIYEDADIRFSS